MRLLQRFVQPLTRALRDMLGLFAAQYAELEQVVDIGCAYRPQSGDPAVEQRLGETGIVIFVVAAATVAIHVDHYIQVKAGAKCNGQADCAVDRLRILSVDMDDGNLQHSCNIRRIPGGSARRRRSGKADLIVQNYVHRAAGGIAGQRAQIKQLLHDSLAGKSGIAVNNKRQHMISLAVTGTVLAGAGPAQNDRRHELEVTGIEAQ